MEKKLLSLLLVLCLSVTIILLSVQLSPIALAGNMDGYIWPTPDVTNLTQGYGNGHYGVDIAAKVGTTVIATKSGIVTEAFTGCVNFSRNLGSCKTAGKCKPSSGRYGTGGYCNDNFGIGLILHHDDGTWSCYCHMSELDSRIYSGVRVTAGQVLGKTGSTGNSSGPHMHFEIRDSKSSTNYWGCSTINPLSVSYIGISPSGAPTAPSYFKYSEATNPTYTSKARIDETNAVVVTKAEKSSGVEVYYTGIDLYDSENKLINRFTYKNTNVSASQTMFHVWWDFNAEVGITLTPGTTYRYRFTAETSIGNFTGDLLSFTTKGNSPTPEKPLTVTVTFDAMGGSMSSNAKEVTPGKPYGELPSAYKDGYTFDGWFTSPDGGEMVTENTVVSNASGHTLYAHWTQMPLPASTVSIDVYVRLYKADGNEFKEYFWQTLTPEKSVACYFTPPAYEGYDYFRVGVTDSVESFTYTDGDLCCFTASADGKIYIFYAPVDTEKTQWPITVKANPSTCIDLVSASHNNAAEGDKITIKLSSNDKFMPVGISVKDGKGNTVTFEEGKDNSYTFTMPDETVQVTGSFKETVKDKPVYDIKVSSTVGGRILVSLEKSRSGEDITVKVVPYESNKFKSLSITTAQGYAVKYKKVDESIYTFKMPDSSVTVNTVFEAINETPDEPKDEPLNNPFADVAEKDWFYDAVAYTAKNGLMGGKTNGIFDPNGITTRAEMVTILYRMDGNPTVTKDVRFDDVPGGQWYSDAISWAAANEIVGGYGNGKFGMDDTITREQMAAILYRYASYKGYDLTKLANLTGYTDADTVSDWAVTAMRWAVAEGVINGTSTTILSPSGDSTRAQVATIFMRFYENIVK